MERKRLAELKELPKSTDDVNDRADHEMMLEREFLASAISPLEVHDHAEAWLEHLASWAQMPEAVD